MCMELYRERAMQQDNSDIDRQRVFCVGMNKTGTSTLKACFEILDMIPVASPKTLSKNERTVIQNFYGNQDYCAICKLAKNFVTFENRPWNMWEMCQHLDECFPNSLFILTID